ncbi:MAG: FAD-dependent monooxygenase [Pseudonocardiaceae bacterium]
MDVQADALRVQHWVMNAFVAERFRHGRILLAGDAATSAPAGATAHPATPPSTMPSPRSPARLPLGDHVDARGGGCRGARVRPI